MRHLSGKLLPALLLTLTCHAGAISARIVPLADSVRIRTKTPAPAAAKEFADFTKRTGTTAWQIRYSPRTALPEAIIGAKTHRYTGSPQAAAMSFIRQNSALLGVNTSQLKPAFARSFMGTTHLQFSQEYKGIPVEFAYVRVHINAQGEVTGYQAKYEPDTTMQTSPALDENRARQIVAADLGPKSNQGTAGLVFFPELSAAQTLRLAWKIKARSAGPKTGAWIYYIDALDGRILFSYDDLRRACPSGLNTTFGTVTGAVYPISPEPTYSGAVIQYPERWNKPSIMPIKNQYVWITDILATPSKAVTNASGEYCSARSGKVFASLKGPYFSVVNFQTISALFSNGGPEWAFATTPLTQAGGLNQVVTLNDNWSASGWGLAAAMPHFTAFSVGAMDRSGTITAADELLLKNDTNIMASYLGARTKAFYGALIEAPSYTVALENNAASSYTIDYTAYLLHKNFPTVTDNASGTIYWSSTSANVYISPLKYNLNGDEQTANSENSLAEINAFYHLNSAYEYFTPLNRDPITLQPPADLASGPVPVMVHANGLPDAYSYEGMMNAFYDLERDNIYLGDGAQDLESKAFRSFALDGTIIRHEYIHRVNNKIYPTINLGEFGAISEGLADYFALASFWKEGESEGNPAKAGLKILGNFIDSTNEGMKRDISGDAGARKMPDNWSGEIHDDSLIFSQALYDLRKGATNALGTFASGIYNGLAKTDVFTYAAMFYFPDNFANFYDAFTDACAHLDDAGCPASTRTKIDSAFAAHGIPSYMTAQPGYDHYDTASSLTGLCRNNNGPECATDASSMTVVSGTIFPAGDLDYYTVPLPPGKFQATLTMPAFSDGQTYYSYGLYLFDSSRNYIKDSLAEVYNSPDGTCQSADCRTLSRTVSLDYEVAESSGGRYYLAVAGGPSPAYGNSIVNSTQPYSLNLSFVPTGLAQAQITAAIYDNDTLSFSVPYAKFSSPPFGVPPSSGTLTGDETVFSYAQLRDHNYVPMSQVRTNLSGGYLTLKSYTTGTNYAGLPVITGEVALTPGFAARYPGAGTVYLEIFGRNHMGSVTSLGVSSALNLSTNQSEMITYNNIISRSGQRATIKYDLLSAGNMTIKIYTIAGTLVKTVFNGSIPAGKGSVDWDGLNSSGEQAASGIYYVVANGPGLKKTDKIAIVR